MHPVKPTEQIDFSNSNDHDSLITKPKAPSGSGDSMKVNIEEFFDMSRMENGTPIYFSGTEGPIFLCCHGAGHSGLSFALLSREITKFARQASFDYRGHGYSTMTDDPKNLQIDVLVKDTLGTFF